MPNVETAIVAALPHPSNFCKRKNGRSKERRNRRRRRRRRRRRSKSGWGSLILCGSNVAGRSERENEGHKLCVPQCGSSTDITFRILHQTSAIVDSPFERIHRIFPARYPPHKSFRCSIPGTKRGLLPLHTCQRSPLHRPCLIRDIP